MYTVVLPVLNEAGNLTRLLPILKESGCEIIVCDNGSTDGSQEAAVRYGAQLSRGVGSVVDAVLRGLREASYERIIVMDADFSHPPELVPEIASELLVHDMVLGSRYCKGGMSRDTFLNVLISRVGNLLTLGLCRGVSDRMSGFFGIRKFLTQIPINQGTKPALEYIVRASPTSVLEVPFTFKPRQFGSSKLGRKKVLGTSLLEVFRLYKFKYKRFTQFACVGGVGALWYMLFTYIASLLGWPLIYGMIIGAGVATIWNFNMNRLWTFGRGKLNLVWNMGRDNDEGDFDWWEWYGDHPVKRFWKRRMGGHIKELAGRPRSLLSLGCGSSPVINQWSCKRVGVDINPAKIEFLKNHTTAELHVSDIRSFDVNGRFETVICNEVLEHLPLGDVEHVVAVIADATTSKAVISIPDYGSRLGRLLETKMHGHFHDNLTVKHLDSLCATLGLVKVKEKRWLWDTAILYKKVEK